jgi:hypothetical protein
MYKLINTQMWEWSESFTPICCKVDHLTHTPRLALENVQEDDG